MKWDHGVRNSYRMGAEGKYDLKLVNCDNLPLLEAGCSTSNAPSVLPTSTKKFEKANVLVNRKSSSTPSLPEATENLNISSVASTDQASSADNLTWKQAVETIAENVLTSAKSDIVSSGVEEKPNNQPDVHMLRELEHHHDLSLINHTQNAATSSDLATITENYTLGSENVKCNVPSSSAFVHAASHSDDKLTNIEANNKMNSSNSVNSISKTLLGSLRGCSTTGRVSQISSDALDVIDKMREIRNSTNNIISSEILQIPPNAHLGAAAPVKLTSAVQKHSNASSSDGEKHRSKYKASHGLKPSKRQIVTVDESCAPVTASLVPIVVNSVQPIPTAAVAIPSTAPQPQTEPAIAGADENNSANNSCDDVVGNPMSISVPNLASSNESTSQIVPVSPPGLLETFAALASRRRTSGSGFQTNNQVNTSVFTYFP